MILPDHRTDIPPEVYGVMLEVGASRVHVVCIAPGSATPWARNWNYGYSSLRVSDLGWKFIESPPMPEMPEEV